MVSSYKTHKAYKAYMLYHFSTCLYHQYLVTKSLAGLPLGVNCVGDDVTNVKHSPHTHTVICLPFFTSSLHRSYFTVCNSSLAPENM